MQETLGHTLAFHEFFLVVLGAFIALRVVLIGLFYTLRNSRFGEKNLVYRVPLAKGQLRSERVSAFLCCVADALVITCLVRAGLLTTHTPTVLNVLTGFVLHFVWLEFWFYSTHRLAHTRPFYWMHRAHHVAKVCTPESYVSFSVPERLLLLTGFFGSQVFASQVMGTFSYASFAACLLFEELYNLLGHSNVEVFPKGHMRSKFFFWINSPTMHAMHHARMDRHFGLFTTWFDRLFGTLYTDSEILFDKAKSGEGMSRLLERYDRGRGVAVAGADEEIPRPGAATLEVKVEKVPAERDVTPVPRAS